MKDNTVNHYKINCFLILFFLFLLGLIFYLIWGSSIFNVWLTPFFIIIQIIFSWLFIKKNKKIWLLLIFGMALSHYLICFVFLPRLFTSTNCDFFKMEFTICDCRGIKVYDINKKMGSVCYGVKKGVWYNDSFNGKGYVKLENNQNNKSSWIDKTR